VTNAQLLPQLAAWEFDQVTLTHFPRADIYPALIFNPILADVKTPLECDSFANMRGGGPFEPRETGQ